MVYLGGNDNYRIVDCDLLGTGIIIHTGAHGVNQGGTASNGNAPTLTHALAHSLTHLHSHALTQTHRRTHTHTHTFTYVFKD